MRGLRASSLLLPALLLVGLLSPAPAQTSPALRPAATTDYQPALPVNATFFYPVQVPTASRYHGNLPVDSNDVDVIARQVRDMQYAGQQVGLYSWAGRGSFSDQVFDKHLRAADDTTFRWVVLDEMEGASGPNGGDPTVTQIRADLDRIWTFAHDPSYFRIGGKPVVFAYSDVGDTCDMASRWRSADSTYRFAIVLRVVPGWTGCASQPWSWYGYAPANGHLAAGHSYAVSPGFNKVSEPTARLARSLSRFTTDLKAMRAARVQWRLTTTWNEWYDGTSTDSAKEWATSSGHGAYADAMHAVLGSAPSTPAPPPVLNAVTDGQRVDLSWSAISGATGYQVFRNGCLAATVGTTPSWTDTTLTDASASYYVKTIGVRGTSRRGPLRTGVAGTPVAAPTSTGEGLVASAGTRILSTATGAGLGCATRLRGRALLTLPASVPPDATAVVLGLTTVNAQGLGSVEVYPAGTAGPPVHELRYYSSKVSSTQTVVPIGTGRQVVVQQSGAATHLFVDLLGWTAPGPGSLTAHSSERFLDTRSGLGGVPTGTVSGTLTAPLPSYVPADATAVQVRLLVTGATAGGSAVVFPAGAARPPVVSLAYAGAVSTVTSVLVPVGSTRQVSVYLSSPATAVAGIEGWVTTSGSHLLQTPTATRLVATTTRQTAVGIQLPAADAGKVALVSVGVAAAAGYGNLSVYPDQSSAPVLQTVAYGPQQPQSGMLWVRVPANGVLRVSLSSAALVYVDLLGVG